MNTNLKVPCTYQGGKQRIAPQIVDIMMAHATPNTSFYDLCCGSGAISVELVNRGVSPNKIYMQDISSWGSFWQSVGNNTFDLEKFEEIISNLPLDKRAYKDYCLELSSNFTDKYEAEIYLVLQANSFGGKQISLINNVWHNACFRSFWKPTATSIRRSPANPMQPSAQELLRRVKLIISRMVGLRCNRSDISTFNKEKIRPCDIVYIDPPYKNTTGYAYNFDIIEFIKAFTLTNKAKLFVSEGVPLCQNSIKVNQCGANGGISGVRKNKHEEWLSIFE